LRRSSSSLRSSHHRTDSAANCGFHPAIGYLIVLTTGFAVAVRANAAEAATRRLDARMVLKRNTGISYQIPESFVHFLNVLLSIQLAIRVGWGQ